MTRSLVPAPPVNRQEPTGSFWLFQLAGWSAFWIAMTTSRVGRFPLDYMVASKGALTVMGFAITSFILRPLYRRLLRGEPPLRRILLVTVVLSYVAAMLWTAGDNIADIPIAGAVLGRTVRITSIAQLFGGTLYNAFALLAWSVLYVGVKHYRAFRDARERALRAEALAHQARLDALRYQLNPHFLFNTLNAISTLVVDGRNDEASRMIARLGDLLRTTLERTDGDVVSLADELELVRRYLDIEQIRLGERLAVHIDVAEDAWAARVPSLILQPLVENAIRHGVAPREEGGRVTITATRMGGLLQLHVADDGPGLRARGTDARASSGIGLANTRERLKQLYGEAHRFDIGESDSGGLRVSIELPFTPVEHPSAKAPLGERSLVSAS